MSERLETLFDEYRRTGEPARLAEVFDATWEDLLRVALHLSQDPVEAEDLVQETFLHAIESAPHYDPERALRPWLVGILSNAARRQRRRRGRAPRPDSPDWPDWSRERVESPPGRELEGRELTQGVARALSEIPELYAQVLHLRLRRGLETRDISRVLKRPHATVRTQVKRGLELLRRSLPPGLALPAWMHLPEPRGADAVREDLLRHAADALQRTASPLHAAPLATLGGLLVAKKIGLILALVVTPVAALLLGRTFTTHEVASPEARAAALPERASLVARDSEDSSVALDREPVDALITERRELDPTTRPNEVARLASVRVLVRWSGEQGVAPRVSLRLFDADEPADSLRYTPGVTDDSGSASFSDIEPGDYVLLCDRGGRASFALEPGEAEVIEMEVESGPRLVGRVVDEDGQAIARADVWIATDWSFRNEGESLVPAAIDDTPAARTESDGSFEIPSIGKATFCGAWAAGYAPSDDVWLRDEGVAVVEVEIVLPRAGSSLYGVVVDADDRPVAGATVLVDVGLRREDNVDGSGVFRNTRHVQTRTDEQGEFRFPCVQPGANSVYVRASRFVPWEEDIELEPDGEHRVFARLERAASVRGRVEDRFGGPLAGVSVRLVPAGWAPIGHPGYASWTRTRKDGRFHLDGVAPGQAALVLDGGEHGVLHETLTLAGDGQHDLVLVLGSERLLYGRVVDEEKRPLVGIEVQLTVNDAGEPAERGVMTTDEDGAFRFENLESVTYGITLFDGGPEAGRSYSFEPSSEERILVLLPDERPTARLVGGIVGAEAGIPNAMQLALRATPVDRGLALELEDLGDGRFRSEPFLPGTYRVELRHDESPRLSIGAVTITADETVDLGWLDPPEPGKLDIYAHRGPLRTKQLIHMRLDDAEGRVVWDYLLFEWEEGEPMSVRLAPGDYGLSLWGGELVPTTTPFEVKADETVRVDVELEIGHPFRVSFILPDAQTSLEYVAVSVRRESGEQVFALSLDDETWSDWRAYLALRPGSYSLEARSDTGLEGRLAFEINTLEAQAPEFAVELR